ncbi:uncharacterized protein LOC121373079 [Gigantopelta aegis]|uniref:uncharacterized protein LOC121373079 n=1 Tax=Gigantopelta aegis TaxID=1735272 RepID=UPI001B887BA0|nr:uncharacterized protein LOC121373079 [Gigantopelta aegis]
MAAQLTPRNLMSSCQFGLCVLLVSVFLAGQTDGAVDKTICDPAKYKQDAASRPGPAKPKLPQQFTTRVECNIRDKGYTIDLKEYYDYVNNRGTVEAWKNDTRIKAIYDYTNNELLILNYPSLAGNGIPSCTVSTLSTSKQKFLFGLSTSTSGSEHIYSAAGALRFGNGQTEVYKGRRTIRDGTVCDVWDSCLYVPRMDGTFYVSWAFSAVNNWTSATAASVPVELQLSGVVNKPTRQNISNYYEFTDFRPYLPNDSSALETDPGTYCKGRVMGRPLPNVTSRFRFESELVELSNNYVNWIKEYYDYDLGLVRYDYKPDPNNPSKFGNNKMTRVHDFFSGVAYNLDPMIGNCTITTIDAFGFDAKSKDKSHVRMRTQKEFFYFDKTKYEYAGKRMARDIDCDVYVAIRHDFPPGYTGGLKTIWEWYFATSQWMESVGYLYEFGLPVKLQITCPDDPTINMIYNIYNYDEDNPRIYQTDISGCFNHTAQHIIQFAFPGTFEKDVSRDLQGFKLAVLQQIVATCSISPLRVNNMQVDYYQHGIIISFTMLDKPPIQGDTHANTMEVQLGDAVAKLRITVTTGQFVVALNPNIFKGVKPLVAQPYSDNGDVVVNYYYGNQPPPQGYSGGAMAGLAVAMLLISFLIGFGVLFAINKLNLFGRKNVEGGLGFEPRTYENTKQAVAEEHNA